MSFLNLMTLWLIPCFFLMDLYNIFIFKSEWTYVTDCVDFSSVLHGLQMAEYSCYTQFCKRLISNLI